MSYSLYLVRPKAVELPAILTHPVFEMAPNHSQYAKEKTNERNQQLLWPGMHFSQALLFPFF